MGAAIPSLQSGLLNQSSAQMVDGSLKFVSGSSTNLSRTPSSAGNRKTFTWSSWVKRSTLSTDQRSLLTVASGTNDNDYFQFGFYQDKLVVYGYSTQFLATTQVFRDVSAWMHIVLSVDTTNTTANNRLRLYVNGSEITSFSGRTNPSSSQNLGVNRTAKHQIGIQDTGYPFDGSLTNIQIIDGQALGPGYFGFIDPLTGTWRPKKVRQGDTSPVNDGTIWSSGTKTTTGSGLYSGSWDKVFDGNLNIGVANGAVYVYNNSSATLTFPKPLTGYISVFGSNGSNSATDSAGTDQIVLSDGSIFDVSGLDVPDGKWYNFGYKENITSIRAEHNAGSGQGTFLRAIAVNGVELLDNDTSSVDFGTNGFYLPMDNDDFNIDKSGKGNNWTKNNFSGTFNDPDVLKDSPSGAVSGGRAQTGITTTSSAPSNYATANPLDELNATLSNGNLDVEVNSAGTNFANSSISVSSGKWYFEITVVGGTNSAIGVADVEGISGFETTGSYVYYQNTGALWYTSASAYGAAWQTAGDVIGITINMDTPQLIFYKNNISQGVAVTSWLSGKTVVPCFTCGGGSGNKVSANFGQKPFKYAPPQGFLPLNSASATPETVITRPDHYVGATIYTGDGGASKSISGLNFGGKPDLVWVKGRSYSISHLLYDSVRGAGSTKSLVSNGTNTEGSAGDNATFGYVSSLDNNGFSLVGGSDVNNGYVNKNTATYVGWCWRAGGNKNTFNVDDVGYASAAAAGLGGGTLTPSGASVGTKQGFSIIKYTGNYTDDASFSHGLGKIPKFVIVKATGQSTDWATYHSSLGLNSSMYLNSPDAATDQGTWGNTNPTTSLMYIANSSRTNSNSEPYIAYCWADVPGLQKFGSYIGGGNAFVELGFRPVVVIFKSTGSENWNIFDSTRTPFNSMTKSIQPNLAGAEYTSEPGMDFLSNGFKCRGSVNTSATYVYAAWAEAPSFNLYGGQSNAR